MGETVAHMREFWTRDKIVHAPLDMQDIPLLSGRLAVIWAVDIVHGRPFAVLTSREPVLIAGARYDFAWRLPSLVLDPSAIPHDGDVRGMVIEVVDGIVAFAGMGMARELPCDLATTHQTLAKFVATEIARTLAPIDRAICDEAHDFLLRVAHRCLSVGLEETRSASGAWRLTHMDDIQSAASQDAWRSSNAIGYVYVQAVTGRPIRVAEASDLPERMDGIRPCGRHENVLWPSLRSLVAGLSSSLPGQRRVNGVAEALQEAARHGWFEVVSISPRSVDLVRQATNGTLSRIALDLSDPVPLEAVLAGARDAA